ncbi:MAG: thioredoxin-disulfide reductase [Bacteroidales bacterium]|nr:thioredoxin-disulfide reductase [Bacteroidales bacterium]
MNLSEDNKDKPKTSGNVEKVKCLIIGSGPAGYTAAIYAARANLSPVLYEGLQPGGQLTTTNDVENFPGYPEGINGTEMMMDFRKQAERFGTDIRYGLATSVDFSGKPHKVVIDDDKTIEADAVIIATGATAKYLGLESEEKFKGSGVSACATCDGFFYRGKVVAVVGGGDSAAEEATYLANLCSKVYLIIRKPFMRASKIMIERVEKTPNLEVLYEHVTKEVVGDQVVNGVIVENTAKGETYKLDIDGFFLAIGHTPNSEIFKPYLETDEVGYIKTKPDTAKTNVSGVFACGDVMDSQYRQAVTAAGTGCRAALDAERYLGELGSH